MHSMGSRTIDPDAGISRALVEAERSFGQQEFHAEMSVHGTVSDVLNAVFCRGSSGELMTAACE